MREKAIVSWSGGKDSALALYEVAQAWSRKALRHQSGLVVGVPDRAWTIPLSRVDGPILSTAARLDLIEQMPHLVFLRLQIAAIVLIGRDLDRHALDDAQTVAVHADDLLGIVRQ